LEHNTTYYTRIRVSDTDGQMSVNSNVIGTTTTIEIGAPFALGATSRGQTSFQMNWEAVAGAQKYFYDLSLFSDFHTFVKFNIEIAGGTTSLVINTGLSADTTYYYRLRAFGNEEVSPNSNVITVSTIPNIPSAPTATAGTGMTSSSFIAHWNNIGSATGYKLDVSDDPSFNYFIFIVHGISFSA
jgi:hypothetical protein